MLWAIMKAAADMADATHNSIVRRKAADKLAKARYCKLLEQEEFAETVKTEAELVGTAPAKSAKFVQAVAAGLQSKSAQRRNRAKTKFLQLWT